MSLIQANEHPDIVGPRFSGFAQEHSVSALVIKETHASAHRNPNAAREDCTAENWLVMAAQNGENLAFVQLVQEYSPMVSRVVARITGNEADTEDCMQDAVMRAFVNIRRFRCDCTFASWFTRIGINSALMLLRKRRSRRESPIEPRHDDGAAVQRDFPDRSPNPEEIYGRRERHLLVQNALQSLSHGYRPLLEMHGSGCSLKEISVASGLSMQATKARLFRGKRFLRARIQQSRRTT
jgi:RNA polymerase sigma-70 factor (ECF subfamily)